MEISSGTRTPHWSLVAENPNCTESIQSTAESQAGDSLTTPPCKGALVPILLPEGGAVRVGRGLLRASLIAIRQHFLLMGTPDLVLVACLL